jgi:plasmid stabilization system protein ParE
MRDYELSSRAVADMVAARSWYDQYSLKLGEQFVDAVVAAIREARERPASFPKVEKDIRAVRCRRFPYRIYFVLSPDDKIEVLSVYHTARNPRKWNDADRD